KIEVLAPRAVAGPVDLEITDGSKTTVLPDGFTYLPLPFTFVDASWSRVAPLAVDGGGVAIADADGDGHADILQAARGEGVWVYPNDGKGTFDEPKLLAIPGAPLDVVSIVPGDFDGD